MFGLGFQELLIILVIILLLFGGKKLPELSRSIGQAIKELRGGFSDTPRNEKVATAPHSTNQANPTQQQGEW